MDNSWQDDDKPGFFDIGPWKNCTHPEHEPPGLLHIPPGKGYRHICPGCGRKVVLYGSSVTM